jgi:lipopolysaccharide export system permease protein
VDTFDCVCVGDGFCHDSIWLECEKITGALMISILYRYITKTIILASAAVILAVLGLSFIIGLLGELRDIGTGDYGFQEAVIHIILRMPHDLYQFFPMLVLLGGVLGLGILSSNHELIVMRASGMSVQKVIRAVLSAALILIVVATLIGEVVAPRAIYIADKRKDSVENGGQAVATASGVWLHDGNNFLHIDRVIGKNHLEGVKRYEFDDQHRLLAAYYVKKLDLQNGEWRLTDMVKTTFQNNNSTSSEQAASGTWNLKINPTLLNVGLVEPEELSLHKLASYSKHLVENGLQASRFQFEFWKRVFQPITTLVMILLAIPFVFGAPRSVTMGWRILFSVMIGFAFYLLNAFLGQFSIVFQISPFIAALFPTVLFALLGYVFMLRARG